MTVTAVAVHPVGENPIFGEQSTTVRLDDEAAGCFIVLEQETGSVRLCAGELPEVFAAAKWLLGQKGAQDK